ncbi:MAG: glycerol-3-phosphate acyltransferase [Kiritimatiellae bacterium]|nr:glycerol-3-phosphate acyltransferase [Kiritimatiellia bacterium]
MIRDVGVVVIAYVVGCVQTGYYLVLALTGQDLRRVGSGSTGARNAGRVLGLKGFLFTLCIDAGKGALAVAVPIWFGASPLASATALVAVAVGHVWPIQLRFCGGRGVAVGLGGLAVFDPRLLGMLVGITLFAWVVSRCFQFSGVAGFAAIPFAAWFFELPGEALAGVVGLSLLVLFTHRSHISGWLRPVPAAGDRSAARPGD